MKTEPKPSKSDPRGTLKYLLTVGGGVWRKIWSLLRIILPIFIALWVFSVFGGRGFLYLALAFTIIVLVRIIMNFKDYLNIVRYAEMKVFGKPLDRKYWKEERPQMPKVVWRKTNDKKE